MGNCFRRDSSTVWAGHGGDYDDDDDEYWGSFTRPIHGGLEKEGLLASSIREIKIKISKKELEELVGRVEEHQFPRDQVLSRLINASQHCEEVLRQRSWRPRLQTIPEVN